MELVWAGVLAWLLSTDVNSVPLPENQAQSSGSRPKVPDTSYFDYAFGVSFGVPGYGEKPYAPEIPNIHYNGPPNSNVSIFFNLPNTEDGYYGWRYVTGNGLEAYEESLIHYKKYLKPKSGADVVGNFEYTAPGGELIRLFYTADEKGFVPEGAHLPTPPPIPPEILEALKKNAADEAAGIFDDGRYREEDITTIKKA